MIVLIVNSGSPAQASGILRGDVITDIAGVRVRNINDFRSAVAKGGPLEFTLLRDRQEIKLTVTL